LRHHDAMKKKFFLKTIRMKLLAYIFNSSRFYYPYYLLFYVMLQTLLPSFLLKREKE